MGPGHRSSGDFVQGKRLRYRDPATFSGQVMPLSVTYQGRTVRSDGLTVEQLDAIEAIGSSRIRLVTGLLSLITDDYRNVRLSDVDIAEVSDDLPLVFREGVPVDGRTADRYIAVFGKPPFCWPPSLIRAQQLRDLDLILNSLGA
jgi:hypothetical protein